MGPPEGSENEIKVWEGLGPLPQLHTLNLQTNQLTVIPEQLPEIPKLRALVLTENKLKDAKQVPRLLGYKSLQELSISANPFEEELGGDARKQIIISLCVSRSPTIHLSRIISKVNDEPFGEEEQTALIEELVQQAEEERIRKAEEEEERRQKEEEEKRIREEEERERKEKEEEDARERKAREEEEAREKAEAEKARLEREEAEAKEKAEAPPEDDDGKAAVVEPAGDEGQPRRRRGPERDADPSQRGGRRPPRRRRRVAVRRQPTARVQSSCTSPDDHVLAQLFS